jgi:predicted ATPase
MLSEIQIANFKCYERDHIVTFRQLNLLTGINSQGKSTQLQPLLCLHQSMNQLQAFDRLRLNGKYVKLGNYEDVRNRNLQLGNPVRFHLEFTRDEDYLALELRFRGGEKDERWLALERWEIAGQLQGEEVSFEEEGSLEQPVMLNLLPRDRGPLETAALRFVAEHLGRVHFVSADRLGPRDYFTRESLDGFPFVGARGEHTAEMLYRLRDEEVTPGLNVAELEPDRTGFSVAPTVLDQARNWLSWIFGGGHVDVLKLDDGASLALRMNADGSSARFRMANLGFGYTCILPIITSGLIARPGDILVVENPEAHLHPMAQTNIGTFLARVASTGVQVFVESHSEHVLNALRVAVRERILPSSDVHILYFKHDLPSRVLRIPIHADGSITSWPDGFFDQRSKDFFKLHGV